MQLRKILEGKREWRAHMSRVKSLPKDYQIVYEEIQKYFYKIGPIELSDGIGLLTGIVDLFEEGALQGKGVLEVTGNNVADFCDDLLRDSKTYFDHYQESINQKVNQAMIKSLDKKSSYKK